MTKATIDFRRDDDCFTRIRKILRFAGVSGIEATVAYGYAAEAVAIYMQLDGADNRPKLEEIHEDTVSPT